MLGFSDLDFAGSFLGLIGFRYIVTKSTVFRWVCVIFKILLDF